MLEFYIYLNDSDLACLYKAKLLEENYHDRVSSGVVIKWAAEVKIHWRGKGECIPCLSHNSMSQTPMNISFARRKNKDLSE